MKTEKKQYYILGGEGETGTWEGPYTTTERGIRQRLTRERGNGNRWASAWELYPETDTRKACVVDIDDGDMRDVPEVE